MIDVLKPTIFPLSEIVDVFVHMQKAHDTQRAYRHDIEQALTSLGILNQNYHDLVALPIPELHKRLVLFLSHLAKRDVHGHILNSNTLSRKRYTLVKFFRFLMEVHGFPQNPAVSLPRYAISERSNTPVIGEEELFQFLRALSRRRSESQQAFRDYLIVLGLFHFALRRKELAGLKWSDIHPTPQPHFRVLQKRNRLKCLPIPPKYEKYLSEFALLHGKDSDFIFHPMRNNRTQNLDRPLSTTAIHDLVLRLGAEYLPGKKIMPHSFRATFICLARKYHLDDRAIMNATGHRSGEMINYYDVREVLLANAINHFGERIE